MFNIFKKNIISAINPNILLSGGILEIELKKDIDPSKISNINISIGNKSVIRILAASSKKIIVQVMIKDLNVIAPVTLYYSSKVAGESNIILPWKLSNDKYIIASSPASDEHANIYFIDLKEIKSKNGTIYRHNLETDRVEPYVTTIPSPSSIYVYDNVLWVTSVTERKLYRVVGKDDYEVFSQGLGSAFGIAFDSKGGIFVGDQTGNLFKIDYRGRASFYTNIPESFKGYHFTFSPDDDLYFSVPSSMGLNYIYRIKNGEKTPEVFLKTYNLLGGICFSKNGDLFWAENTREEGIVYKLDKNGNKKQVVSGSFIIGVHIDRNDNIIITDINHIYRVFNKWIKN
ncbi:MAG TPA: hypothetical protein PKW55_03360 [Spirochaetota bacterium]|nr:hypothetical protein [Spirochaetota bacterium]HOM38127.1 hypothetical protein [Spirochaetota bacterium]HPQ48929.1 hypothetical protein [Spirochaetota bacterium]